MDYFQHAAAKAVDRFASDYQQEHNWDYRTAVKATVRQVNSGISAESRISESRNISVDRQYSLIHRATSWKSKVAAEL